MPVLPRPPAPTHDLGSTRFTSLATPSVGSSETALWEVVIEPGAPPTPHAVTRGEIFVVIDGIATVTIDHDNATATPGDTIIIPPDVRFELRNNGRTMLRMLCCMPVGGQARLEDGSTFTPPWAE